MNLNYICKMANAHRDKMDTDVDSINDKNESLEEKTMTWSLDEDVERENRLMSMDEQWRIIFNEQARAPIYTVDHYINYLRRFVEGKPLQSERHCGGRRPKDAISPLSYFLRRLKLDLRLSYDSFLVEFNKPPNGGIKLLFSLLKQLQTGSSTGSSANQKHSSISSRYSTCSKLEDYKRNLTDEHDCLLCVKFCLRLQSVLHELVNDPDILHTLVWGLLSSHVKSRITSVEILTLALMSEDGFERVFDAFTYMRLKLGESVRFKLLISMLNSQGASNILFQISCMRFLNMLLNTAPSVDLRVYLQEEIRMAGFELNVIEKNSEGDGLEYDDLKRETEEWTSRYINVQSLLTKLKHECQSTKNGHYLRTDYAYCQPQDPGYEKKPRLNHYAANSRGYSQPNLFTAQYSNSDISYANGRSQSNNVTSQKSLDPIIWNIVLKRSLPSRVKSMVGVKVSEERFNLSQFENRLRTMRRQHEVTGSRKKLFVPNVSYSLSEIEQFVNNFDIYAFPGDSADLLINILHSLHEKSHMYSSNSNLPFLVSLDQLATHLSTLDQCEDKLKLIGFMSHFTERIKELHEKIDCIATASFTLNNTPKFKQIFEIIVEFGNRLHSSQSNNEQDKFGLSSLESLSKTDVSSTVKSETLLDYIVSEVNQHYSEIGDWSKHFNIAVPHTVTMAVIEKQINYLKEGISILQAELKQREDVHTIQDFLKTASKQLREVQVDYDKMVSVYNDICHTFHVEPAEWEPRQLFGVIMKFAEDFEKSSMNIKVKNDSHSDSNNEDVAFPEDIEDMVPCPYLEDEASYPYINDVSYSGGDDVMSLPDISVTNVLNTNDNTSTSLKSLSKENLEKETQFVQEELPYEQNGWTDSYKSPFSSTQEETPIKQNGWLGSYKPKLCYKQEETRIDQSSWLGSYKSKFCSEPVINFNDALTTSRMGRRLSQPRENVDENWLLSPSSSLPAISSAISPLMDDDSYTSNNYIKQAEDVDVCYGDIQHQTFVYPLKERHGEPDGAGSPHSSPCKSFKSRISAPADVNIKRSDSFESYNEELTEILLDFEKTLYANDDIIKPNPIGGHATVIHGPITFV